MATESTVCPRNIKWLRLFLEVSEREDEEIGNFQTNAREQLAKTLKFHTYKILVETYRFPVLTGSL